eukprot:gene19571-47297_t
MTPIAAAYHLEWWLRVRDDGTISVHGRVPSDNAAVAG